MSLQVWLPFTDGTLKQQGLSNAIATSTGAVTLNNTGKLGKCVTFGTATGRVTLPASTMTSFTECSVTFWINISAWQTNWDTFFQAGLGGSPWNNYTFGILRNQGSYLAFCISDNSSATNGNCQTSNLDLNTWYHVAFTYKTGHMCTYVNGNLFQDYSTSIIPKFNSITHISIGQLGNATSYQTSCKMNDFRIYDHCLSPMEVKQLAQGLVLHYPLNNQGFGQENLALRTGTRAPDQTSQVEWRGFKVGSLPITTNETITISFDLEMHIGTAITNGSPYLMIYNTNYKGPHGKWIQITNNTSNPIMIPIGNYSVGSTIKRRVSFTATTASSFEAGSQTEDWIEFYSNYNTENEFTITNLKIEKGSKATPWSPAPSDTLYTQMGLDSNIEFDTSGFGNNSIYNSKPIVSSNTPKYNVSTFFGAYNTPKTNLNNTSLLSSLSSCTIAWWEYTTVAGNSLVFTGDTTSKYIAAGSTTVRLYDAAIGSNISMYKDGNPIATTYSGTNVYHEGTYHTQNEWHHFVMTGVNLSGWTQFHINSYSSGWPLQAYLSDVRIYVTALSADDVKSLYQNSAYIDSSGNVYGAVHSEV